MKTRLLQQAAERTFVAVFDAGEEVTAGLLQFAREQDLRASHFSAIGAFQGATLGFFDLEKKEYIRQTLDEQLEVLSLLGNIVRHRGEPKLHAHVVLGRRDLTALGGHLLEARVRPTLEVMLTEEPSHLQRRMDESTGLPLIEP